MQTESKEMQVYADRMGTLEPLSFDDIRKNTKLVKKALQSVMIDGVDFGTVPGCGDKKGLFKPGAEKLMMLFKLACFPEVQRLTDDPDALEYVVRTRIIHVPTGRELGVGLGSASSNEEKYKWREAVCEEEWEAMPEERRREKWFKGAWDSAAKKRGEPYTKKQVRTNPADLNNTLVKMACKRSKVDAVITCTAASDIFTQDVDEEGQPEVQVEGGKLQRPQPKNGSEPAPAGFIEMKSKFAGTCAGCKKELPEGTLIYYSSKDKKAVHKNLDCAAAAT